LFAEDFTNVTRDSEGLLYWIGVHILYEYSLPNSHNLTAFIFSYCKYKTNCTAGITLHNQKLFSIVFHHIKSI